MNTNLLSSLYNKTKPNETKQKNMYRKEKLSSQQIMVVSAGFFVLLASCVPPIARVHSKAHNKTQSK